MSKQTPNQEAQNSNSLMTPKEVAEMLGVSVGTLAIWRCHKRYPLDFIKCGRLVRYRRSDVESFLSERTQNMQPATF